MSFGTPDDATPRTDLKRADLTAQASRVRPMPWTFAAENSSGLPRAVPLRRAAAEHTFLGRQDGGRLQGLGPHKYIYIYMYVCMYVCVHVYVYDVYHVYHVYRVYHVNHVYYVYHVYLSTYLPIYLHIYLFAYLPIITYLPICLSIYLSIYLS